MLEPVRVHDSDQEKESAKAFSAVDISADLSGTKRLQWRRTPTMRQLGAADSRMVIQMMKKEGYYEYRMPQNTKLQQHLLKQLFRVCLPVPLLQKMSLVRHNFPNRTFVRFAFALAQMEKLSYKASGGAFMTMDEMHTHNPELSADYATSNAFARSGMTSAMNSLAMLICGPNSNPDAAVIMAALAFPAKYRTISEITSSGTRLVNTHNIPYLWYELSNSHCSQIDITIGKLENVHRLLTEETVVQSWMRSWRFHNHVEVHKQLADAVGKLQQLIMFIREHPPNGMDSWMVEE